MDLYGGKFQVHTEYYMSEQTTLGASDTIAEELADSQQEISIAEFFEKNKHMLGFDSNSRAIVTAVKEAVDNALDATEESDILPEINVEIRETGRYYTVVIEDNGPGITKEQVPKIFGKLLYGSRFNSRTQNRGQQGIGISAAVLYSQKTSGKPATVTTVTQESDTPLQMDIMIDTDTNEPVIENEHTVSWDKEHGTRIELEMEANMRGRKQLHRYIKDTAVVNPHARITLSEPKWEFENPRVTDELPQKTEEIKPHPHGMDLGTLQDMVRATEESTLNQFLKNDFTKVGNVTSRKIRDKFRDYHFGKEIQWDGSKLSMEDVVKPESLRNDTETESEQETSERDSDDKENEEYSFEEEFHMCVDNAIYGKSGESIEHVSESLFEDVTSDITYLQLKSAVEDVSEEVEEEYDVRFGTTVRENIVSSVWDFVADRLFPQIYESVDSATSKRKSNAAVYLLAEKIYTELDTASPITELDLRQLIDSISDDVQDQTDNSIGSTAREKIFDSLWEQSVTADLDVPSLSEISEDRDTAEALLEALTNTKVNAPSKKCLSPITEEKLKNGLESAYSADFYTASQRDGSVYKGSPFIVEAGLAYGGDIEGADDQIDLRRFANRVPLVYQQGACVITNVTENIGWRNYKLKQSGGEGAMPRGPVVLLVHIASVNVPFTSESKDAVARAEVLESEIEAAIRECARDLKSYLKEQRSLKDRREKRDKIGEIIPPMSDALAEVAQTDPPDSSRTVSKIMKNLYATQETDGTVEFYNYSPSAVSFTVNVGDSSHDVSINADDTETVSIDSTENIVIRGLKGEKITFSKKLSETLEISEA